MKFKSKEHEDNYQHMLQRMGGNNDEWHCAVAYLLALDVVLNQHVDEVFDFKKGGIKPTALTQKWQTGTSLKTTRLLMNLWNGWNEDYSEEGDLFVSSKYAVDFIFDCSYAPYYLEALKLRFNLQ